MEEFFNDFMKFVKEDQQKIRNIQCHKNWLVKNDEYFKNYYENNIKNENYYCHCCKKEYNINNVLRHQKTVKHKNNQLIYDNELNKRLNINH